jgi:hypothetical protein
MHGVCALNSRKLQARESNTSVPFDGDALELSEALEL